MLCCCHKEKQTCIKVGSCINNYNVPGVFVVVVVVSFVVGGGGGTSLDSDVLGEWKQKQNRISVRICACW